MLKFKKTRRRWVASVFLALIGGLLILFQNFSSIPVEKLQPRFHVAYAQTGNVYGDSVVDARDLAPKHPESVETDYLAVPQGGHDLQSVSEDWLRRQAHLITGGAEQEFLDGLNRRLSGMFHDQQDEDADQKAASAGKSADGEAQKEVSESKEATSLRFTALNKLRLGFGDDIHLTCSFQGSSMQWDFVRSFSTSIDMNLRHDFNAAKSSVLLNYNW